MASEPKKPIEEMLEASAKARRAAFGKSPKMPNPMRARLHDEVRARHGESSTGLAEKTESRPSWLTMFWPRLAVAAAVATLLVVAPAIWWNKTHPGAGGSMQLAENGPGAANEVREAEGSGEHPTSNIEHPTSNAPEAARPEDILSQGPAAAAAARNVTLADNSRAKIEPAQTPGSVTESLDETKRMPEVLATPGAVGQLEKAYVSKDKADAESAVATGGAAAPAAPVAAAPSLGRDQVASSSVAQSGRASARGVMQQFSQQRSDLSFRNTVQVRQTANILNTFQVQQAGAEIRVVDADGSTYTGKLETETSVNRSAAKRKQTYAGPGEPNDSVLSQSRFRASGYNVSLKKPLVFEGNLTAPTAQPQQQLQSMETQEPARIIGTARVHGETPVQVDATAVATLPAATATKAASEESRK